MNKDTLIAILQALPEGTDVTIQTANYTQGTIFYDDQEPRIICNDTYAILTGDQDFYAQAQAVQDLSQLRVGEIVHLLRAPAKTVRV